MKSQKVIIFVVVFLALGMLVRPGAALPVRPSPIPTPPRPIPTESINPPIYRIPDHEKQPGGRYYVPVELRGRVLTEEEAQDLGLAYVDFIDQPNRNHCALADPDRLGEVQIVYDSGVGALVRSEVVIECINGVYQVCWGAVCD